MPPRDLNMQILGLSGDKKGLRVKVRTMERDNFWHVHSDEMTTYQRRVHKRLGGKQ